MGKGFTVICNECGNKEDSLTHEMPDDWSSIGLYRIQSDGASLVCKECDQEIKILEFDL